MYWLSMLLFFFLQNVEAFSVEVLEDKNKRFKLITLFLAEELPFYVFKQLDTAFLENS